MFTIIGQSSDFFISKMEKITITFPDGKTKEYDSGISGFQIASGISKGLAKEALAVEVDGEVQGSFPSDQ